MYCTDGTRAEPRLRCYLNMGTLDELPGWSAAPRGEPRAVYEAIAAAGYDGIQNGDPALCRELGLGAAAFSRVNEPGVVDELAARWSDEGCVGATLHVGYGIEDDDAVLRVVEDIVAARERRRFPLFIETHRSTITQDCHRTVDLIIRNVPEVRFNGDFSHWYTGLEMVCGGIERKWDFIEPVFERVGFNHGRIGTSCCMQVNVWDGRDQPNVDHFREMWTRGYAHFRRRAGPGDFIVFAPELLGRSLNYARLFGPAKDRVDEECDRWQQALVLCDIARECWQAAGERLEAEQAAR